MVGSIYNMGVWDKSAAAWVNVDVRRTLEVEVPAWYCYQETGRSLENGGCVGDPHIVMEQCLVFMCILHCCMVELGYTGAVDGELWAGMGGSSGAGVEGGQGGDEKGHDIPPPPTPKPLA